MTVEQFIESALQKIHAAFPKAQLTYQYKWPSQTHFIKVAPLAVYESDEFIDLDFALSDEFEQIAADASLCFLTEGSLVELDNPTKVIQPSLQPEMRGNPYQEFFAIYGSNRENKVSISTTQTVQISSKYPTLLDIGNRNAAMAA